MTEAKKIAIADAAEMIVGGYAFLRKDDNITIVNLNRDDEHVMVITKDGKMLESSMDPIEQVIALKKWKENAQFMEDVLAKKSNHNKQKLQKPAKLCFAGFFSTLIYSYYIPKFSPRSLAGAIASILYN